MIEIKASCVILESAAARPITIRAANYVPKSMYPYWREIWLERIDDRKEECLGWI
jgi:hypothetical protein